jgi:ribosome maturation factor RimP
MNMVDDQIYDAVQKIVTEAGAELIDCKIFSSGNQQIVRCLVDYPGGGITVGACAAINKRLVSFLDEQEGSYADAVVEINSPGLDRPLRTSTDFLRVKGKMVLLWLFRPVSDTTYIEGLLADISEKGLHILFKQKTVTIPFDAIKVGKERVEI